MEYPWKEEIPFSAQTEVLRQSYRIGKKSVPNRLVVQPMEGCDGGVDGGFCELTKRRYERFAKGGAGLIWFEATAITPEGRANPRQLLISDKTLDDFKRETEQIREIAQKENGSTPLLILQLTHSGRYAKPQGKAAPLIAWNKPRFEGEHPIDPIRIVSDDDLKHLEEQYGVCAALAEKAGFDGADIKSCHGYLMNELMSAYDRPGLYGGSFENRTRLYRNAFESAKARVGKEFLLTSRLNVYDGFPYPDGFGVSKESDLEPDPSEPQRIVDMIAQRFGVRLIDITIGNPYVNPHVNRPFRKGPYDPPEHPMTGVERILRCARGIQTAHPDLAVIASGFSYLKENSIYAAAGAVREGYCVLAGFGRMAFAYPDFAKDGLKNGMLDPKKCCVACGKCSELMRGGTVAGCVIHDAEIYRGYYQQACVKR